MSRECAACGEQIHAHHYPFWNRTLWSTVRNDQIACEMTDDGYHDPWHPDDDDDKEQ